MLKKVVFSTIFVLSLLSVSQVDSFVKNTECDHYFVIEHHDGYIYEYEYNCDGSLVNVTVRAE